MTDKSVTACDDLPFAPLAEGSPVEIASLWRDPATGPAAVMVRFPEGHSEPSHSHTSTCRSVLIMGGFRSRRPDGSGADETFGPGAFAIQPGGEVHLEVNAAEGELVALVCFEGPIDFVPASQAS